MGWLAAIRLPRCGCDRGSRENPSHHGEEETKGRRDSCGIRNERRFHCSAEAGHQYSTQAKDGSADHELPFVGHDFFPVGLVLRAFFRRDSLILLYGIGTDRGSLILRG